MDNRCVLALSVLVFCCVSAMEGLAQSSSPANSAEVRAVSPDGRICISMASGDAAALQYRVQYDGKTIVENSSLGLSFDQGGALANLREVARSDRIIDDSYSLVSGKTSTARNHCSEQDVTFEEKDAPHRRMKITLRAYDDAVAFRYTLPEQPGFTDFALDSEDSAFAFPADAEAWWQPLHDFTTPHEGRFHKGNLSDVPGGQLLGLPLLLHVKGGPWLGIIEADLDDYASMYLKSVPGKPGMFTSALSPLPGQKKIKVRGRTPHASPWRVIMIGDTPGRLIESNAVLNLSKPCALADTSWIKPGKVSFLWWNGYVVAPPAHVGPLDTATVLKYVDFAADHHIAYASIDGSDHAWYGGRCAPYQGADVTVPVPELELATVFAHAKERGVRMRIWVNYHGLKLQVDHALETYATWGAEGVMVDMIERDDQEAVNLMRRIISKCAALHMTVTFHNVMEPTGLQRTYPNYRTSEAVLNLEYNKWDPIGSNAEHELTVPFIRMLAGPLDFHQGGFRSVLPQDFKPHNIAPVVMGTRCHQMAMYVVYEDALPMIVDYPEAYQGQEGFDFICGVPTTWDQTRVIDGTVGQELTIARRKGEEWYIGSMAGPSACELKIPLSFLPGGPTYDAQIWADDPARGPNAAAMQKRPVTSTDTLEIKMSIDGGHVIRLIPRGKTPE